MAAKEDMAEEESDAERQHPGEGEAEKNVGSKEEAQHENSVTENKTPFSSLSTNSLSSSIRTAAAGSGGAAIGASVVNAIADPGYILFIIGILSFLLEGFLQSTGVSVALSTIFLLYSAIFIFKGRGLMLITAFLTWYFLFGGVTNIDAIKYVIVPILLVAMVVRGAYARLSRQNSFSGGMVDELPGLALIAIYFIDLGLVQWLSQEFGLTLDPLSINLLLFTPWWGFLGLFTAQKQNWLTSVSKFIVILYIISVVSFGIMPTAFKLYTSEFASPEELLVAKREFQEGIPQRENSFISNLHCILASFGSPAASSNIPGCVQERQEQSEIKYLCKKSEDVITKAKTMQECIAGINKQREQEALLVSGITDPTIKKEIKITLKESFGFPKTLTWPEGTTFTAEYRADLEIQNPRLQEMIIEVACSFRKVGSSTNPGIPGTASISNDQAAPHILSTKEEQIVRTISCTPPQTEDFEGKYKLTYGVTLNGLTTSSRLQRAFMGEVDPAKKKELVTEILKLHFPGKTHLAQAPKDPAALYFAFGNPIESPIIQPGPLFFAATIENQGLGHIKKVHSYSVDLGEKGFVADNPACFFGEVPVTVQTKALRNQPITLTSCMITQLPLELENPANYELREFRGTVEYDYVVETILPLEIQRVSFGEPEDES